MTAPLADRFGTAKPVIAMLHFPGLPGRPRHDRKLGRAHLVDVVGRDLQTLQAAGVDGLLFCNENDIPYQLAVGPEIPSAMAAVIGELRSDIRVPFGVNILWDARASLALARATGATFIREVLTGVYESDLGMIAPAIGDLAGYRTAIGADDVAFFDNISPEFSSAGGGIPRDGRHPDQRPRGRSAVRDERPERRQGGRSGDGDRCQYGRARGADPGDLQGRRRCDRRNEPQGRRDHLERGGSGPGRTPDGGRPGRSLSRSGH
jgi:hypothetical protein